MKSEWVACVLFDHLPIHDDFASHASAGANYGAEAGRPMKE